MTLDDLDISISEKNKSIFTKDNSIEMKYFLSISLLLLVMHLTVHPILSLHFCSGKLASTEFLVYKKMMIAAETVLRKNKILQVRGNTWLKKNAAIPLYLDYRVMNLNI